MVKGNFDLLQVYIETHNVKNMKPYAINNTHIDCDKDTYDVLNESIVKLTNDEMKTIMNKDIFYFLRVMIIIMSSSNILNEMI